MALAKIQKDDWAPNSERGVPTFDGTMSNYREYRRRVQVYHLRMRLEDREELVGLNLLSGLSGAAWEAVEHIDVLGGDAEKGDPKLIAAILKELDLRFKYDARTELPTRPSRTSSTALHANLARRCSTTSTACGSSRTP